MIKVSHESPLSILGPSRVYNDYDYALVHLFESRPEYYNFFEESLKLGRHVILDNSIFELGTAFDPDRYAHWINKLKPTEYIIPDVLEDCNGTIRSAIEWCIKLDWNNVPNSGSRAIGVVQGKNYGELVKCYTHMDQVVGVDKIAISFDYSYYAKVFPHPNKWVAFMMGRVLTLTRMMNEGVINKHKPHHLLGCAHPREFSFYTGPGFEWIETLDTSSPIVHGLKGVRYGDKIGTWEKERTKLVDLLDAVPDAGTYEIITHNIEKFKSYLT
jgi:hypothetical protein